jgi:hypothetical protein
MFPALRPLFKAVFKILNRNVYQYFFTDDLIVLNVRETLSFQHAPEFWKQPEVGCSQVRRCFFLLKTATLEAKNVSARCRGEESMRNLSTTLLACASRHQQTLSTTPSRMSD